MNTFSYSRGPSSHVLYRFLQIQIMCLHQSFHVEDTPIICNKHQNTLLAIVTHILSCYFCSYMSSWRLPVLILIFIFWSKFIWIYNISQILGSDYSISGPGLTIDCNTNLLSLTVDSNMIFWKIYLRQTENLRGLNPLSSKNVIIMLFSYSKQGLLL